MTLAGRVLLAEDNLVNSKLILRHIQKASELISVVHVDNGQKALEQAMEREFDLILMDVEMPLMNGDEVVRTIRSKGIQTPVWMFTGNTDTEFQRMYKNIGAQGFLAKPIEKSRLLSVLVQCLKT